jgi:hypothetical protein
LRAGLGRVLEPGPRAHRQDVPTAGGRLVTALWAETAAFYSLAVVSVVGMILCSIGSLAHAFHCRNKARTRPPED